MEENFGRPRTPRTLIGAAIVALVALMAPAVAPAQVTTAGYRITSDLPSFPTAPSEGPSTFQAGANPNAGSYSIFTYPNAAEDVKTAKTNFTAGLLGNPEA